MQKQSVFSKKGLLCVICYVCILAAAVVTPFLAALVAPLFDWCVLDWSENGQLRGFFTELFTAIFWVLEMIGGYFVFRRFGKDVETAAVGEGTVADTSAEDAEKVEQKSKEKQGIWRRVKASFDKMMANRAPLLPMKNVGILLGITVFCILLVTLQIGLQVKPFYELGEKVTFSQIVDKGGEWIKNGVKCVWILLVLRLGLRFFSELSVWETLDEKRRAWLQWLGTGVLLLVFGAVDVIMAANEFTLVYLVFYVAFTAVYYFTKQSVVKSFLLILFIYFF